MKRAVSLASVFIAVLCGTAAAYDVPTHYDLSFEAVGRSVLVTDTNVLGNLGLRNLAQQFPATDGQDSPAFANSCQHGSKFQIIRLIACGSQFEDFPGTRSLNHFYDPRDNAPNYGAPTVAVGPPLGKPSPDWALEDKGGIPDQQFSYLRARNYFLQALTNSGPQSDRDAQWGMLFQSLGQVVHHLQDMAQPQHVRNDLHCSLDLCALIGQYNPSLYEDYTRDVRSTVLTFISTSTMDAVYPAGSPGPFKKPRDFWKNSSGSGIAEYTNLNFFSAGTLPALNQGQPVENVTYASPMALTPTSIFVSQLDPPPPQETVTFCGASIGPPCTMTFYSTNDGHPDSYNPRAMAVSIFDQYVKLRPVQYADPFVYQTDTIPTLNKYTFNTAYPLLLPRAVAYSAGMINYFFRGQMQISLPVEGVYAVSDYASGGQVFNKVKLRLQNTTPNEAMSAGSVVAIVKFHRNRCHSAALSSELDTNDPNGCYTADEEIVVSAAGVDAGNAPVTAVPNSPNSVSVSFDFSAHPIPFAATDVSLQVVYQGKLGDEDGAVAVTTKDISEPSYFALANYTDYVYSVADGRYYPLPVNGHPDVINNIRLSLAGDNGPIVASLPTLNGGGHAQLAWLSDIGFRPWALNTTSVFGNFTGKYVYASETGFDEDTQSLAHIPCPYYSNRGVYRDYLTFFLEQDSGGHHVSGSGTQLDNGQTIQHGQAITAGTQLTSGLTANAFVTSAAPTDPPACPDGTGIMNDAQMTPLSGASNWAITF